MRRLKLREAAMDLLKSHSYHELKLEQIASAAEIPTSVFYHYFPNKRTLILELLDEVFARFEKTVVQAGPFGSFENGVIAHNREMLKLYRDNAGLMRCLSEVDEPEFAQIWRRKLNMWHDRVGTGLAQFVDPEHRNEVELAALSLTVGGITEMIAQELYVVQNRTLRHLLPDLETATSYVATIWVRLLFLKPHSKITDGRFDSLLHLRDLD
ncbi:TetR/AcrR family transcriptional regulator [Sphingosinicella microcystinivorans]|nr:TetR/AcrR family transcriptional regulator [Sphingosinicella microcystinivorans]